jgi:hypothetical protein
MTSNAFDLLIVPTCEGLACFFLAAALVRGLVLLTAALVRVLVHRGGSPAHPGGDEGARGAPDKGAGPAPGCERGAPRRRPRRPVAWSPLAPSRGR